MDWRILVFYPETEARDKNEEGIINKHRFLS
jgi:hypothetical protein